MHLSYRTVSLGQSAAPSRSVTTFHHLFRSRQVRACLRCARFWRAMQPLPLPFIACFRCLASLLWMGQRALSHYKPL
eukprot:3384061-Rhodomonas_salina.2